MEEDGRPHSVPERETGTGALCAEAQADGVPCPEVGKKCEICERALARMKSEKRASNRSPDREAW